MNDIILFVFAIFTLNLVIDAVLPPRHRRRRQP